MAEMLLKNANAKCQLGCYSERGMMSYFMFVELPTRLGSVLAELDFPEGVPQPFRKFDGKLPQSIIYSELCFGNEGFGSPDGAIFVDGKEPIMIFIEAKANENYADSCKGRKFNSTIRGQLELRWRMWAALRSGGMGVQGKAVYVRETAELKKMFGDGDCFYNAPHRKSKVGLATWRRLKVTKGVLGFVENLGRCKDQVYYCAITEERKNPFDRIPVDLRPRTGNVDWDQAKRSFCWLPFERIRTAEIVQQEVLQ